MIQVTTSQTWYSALGRDGNPMEPTGDPVFVEAPATVERVIAVGPLDKNKPQDQKLLLQLNPSGDPSGQRLFLWQPRRWVEYSS